MASINIEIDKCIGCRRCVSACPFGAIVVENKKAVILETCTLCGSCASSCKFDAINLQKDFIENTDISGYKGVWVFAEQKNGRLSTVAKELLGQATNLAKTLETQVAAVILGDGVEAAVKQLIAYGADIVYKVEQDNLKQFNDEIYAGVVYELIQTHKPEIMLFGATAYGRSLAPRLSSRLNTGLTADCTLLEIDNESRLLKQTRPAFGGNLMATIICPRHRPQMATVRPKVMKALEPDYDRVGKVITTNVNIPSEQKIKILEVIDSLKEDLMLEEAEIIVAAGRGIGDAKNIRLIEELAELIGGVVGASRSVVDCGWVDYSHQIGQTGKTVSPKIYFACGISGAIQHLAGMSTSNIIIAINNDPNAPIFKIANYGIVGDVNKVLPMIIESIKNKTI